MVDRPVVCVTAPREGAEPVEAPTYRDRVFADMNRVINNAPACAEADELLQWFVRNSWR